MKRKTLLDTINGNLNSPSTWKQAKKSNNSRNHTYIQIFCASTNINFEIKLFILIMRFYATRPARRVFSSFKKDLNITRLDVS